MSFWFFGRRQGHRRSFYSIGFHPGVVLLALMFLLFVVVPLLRNLLR